MNRRSFMMLPALAPLGALDLNGSIEYRFHYDHVIGTSLDLAVWTCAGRESTAVAQQAARLVLDEIDRLATILSTYDIESEICRFDRLGESIRSEELLEVFRIYDLWRERSHGLMSMRPGGSGSPLNVDALGKAYIIDRAAGAVRATLPELDGLLLNIGGDIVVWGRPCELEVADPFNPHDNGAPLTRIALADGAVATSGINARGFHLLDGRTGKPAAKAASATVVARDAVTANALATSLCLMEPEEGFNLVRAEKGAEAIRMELAGGGALRTAGFGRLELSASSQQSPPSTWPAGYEVSIALTLTTPDPRLDRSYAAFWVEDTSGKLVRTIVLWGNKAQVVFSAPGGRTRVVANREDHTAMVETESRGLLGMLGDLHKGADSGRVWFWVIDISAVLLAFTSITGLVTLASLPARRRAGFVVGAIGLFVTILLYVVWTPR